MTWNPITGCLNHVNGLCKGGGFPCYAYRLANGRLKQRYLANEHIAGINPHESVPYIPAGMRELELRNPFYPRFWPERMWLHELVGSKRKAKGIFVCDMSDLFGIGVPEEWTRRVLDVIKEHPQHRFYLLTKQPQNLAKFSPFPPNCFVGVTVTGVEYMADAVANLAVIEARVKFMSFEPLLGSVMPKGLIDFLDWVIIGAQSKPTVYPKIEWVEEIVEAADKAGIPVFIKDNLLHEWGITRSPNFKKLSNGIYKARQEMPK